MPAYLLVIDTGQYAQVFAIDPRRKHHLSLHLYYNSAAALSGNVLPQLAAFAASQGMVSSLGSLGRVATPVRRRRCHSRGDPQAGEAAGLGLGTVGVG